MDSVSIDGEPERGTVLAVGLALVLLLSVPATGAATIGSGAQTTDPVDRVPDDEPPEAAIAGQEAPWENGTGTRVNQSVVTLSGEEAVEVNGVEVGTEAQQQFQTGEQTQVFLRLPPVEPSRTVAAGVDREAVIEQLKRSAERSQEPVLRELSQRDWVTVQNTFWIANAILVEVEAEAVGGPESAVDRLSRLPNIDRLHANHRLEHPDPVPGDSGSTVDDRDRSSTAAGADASGNPEYTWALDQLNVPDVHEEFGARGEGVDVVVLDTGASPAHPDIEIDRWRDFDGEGGRLGAIPFDAVGHGTHVSGIVAGNGTVDGKYYGVAPEANLHVGNVRVPPTPGDRENATLELGAVLSGIEWATDDVGADVLTMSFRTREDWFSEQDDLIEPIRNSLDAGTIVVSSIGNNGPGTSSTPGKEFDTIGVGATTVGKNVAGFSGGGQVNQCEFFLRPALCPVPDHWPENWIEPSVVAPGYDIVSAQAQTGYTNKSGTSMAAPHVAGVVALLLSMDEGDNIDPGYVKDLLQETARTPGSPSEPAFDITNVDFEDSMQAGEQYNVTVTVENTGDRETAMVVYELFDDGLVGGDWRLGSTDAFQNVLLEAGEQRTLKLPGKQFNDGQYDARVRVLRPDEYETITRRFQVLPLDEWDDIEEDSITIDPSAAGTAGTIDGADRRAVQAAADAAPIGPGVSPAQHQGSSTRYGHGIVDAYAAFVNEIDAEILDVSVGTAGGYGQGETVDATVELQNTGNLTNEFFVGQGVFDSTGRVYDNDGSTGTTVELAPGESAEVSVPWTVAADDGGPAPADTYDSVLRVWAQSDRADLRDVVASRRTYDAFTVLPPSDDTEVTITDVDGGAGGADRPRPVTVGVEILVDGEPYRADIDGNVFDITVGTKSVTSTVLLDREQPGVYSLRFVPPTQPDPGEYDLTVAFDDLGGDSRANAITYSEGERTQIASALTIDVSGSMSGILDEAKEGAITFVQRADDTDHVSVVAYETDARIEHPLVELAAGRESVVGAIEGLSPGDSTNIGDAMADGLTTLEDAPEGSIQTGVLLTDGKRTAGPSKDEILNDVVPQYNDRGVCLYTIGFTENADEAFMQELAAAADCGDYRFAGEEGEVDSIQDTLQAVFSDIEGDVGDAETFERDSGTLESGASYGGEAGIDDSVAQATVQIRIEGAEFSGSAASASGGDLHATGVDPTVTGDVSLRRPDGVEVDGTSPLVEVSAVGDSLIYRIEDPVPGEWSYSLTNPRSEPSEYAVDITGDAQATLSVRTTGDTYYTGGETELVASLIGPNARIDGATVEATVEAPDGSMRTVDFTERSPGVYRGTVPADAAGSYTATVRAERGSLSREKTHSWTVQATPPVSIDQQVRPTIVQGSTGTFSLLVDPTTGGSLAGATGLTVETRNLTGSARDEAVQPAEATFLLSDLTPENPTVAPGEEIQPQASIVNQGDEPDTQTIEYRIDGTVVSTGDVQLDPGFGGWVGLEEPIAIDREPGQYSHGFYSEDSSSTGTITVRDQFGITMDVSGLTRSDGAANIPGSAIEVDPRSVTSDASSTVTASVSVPADTPPGEYYGTATAYTSDGRVVTEEVQVNVGGRPTFAVEGLATNGPVTAGESLTAQVQVTNTGDVAGEQTVELAVPPLGSDEETVSLDGGESTTVSLAVATRSGDGGSYEAVVRSDNDTTTAAVTLQAPTVFVITSTATNAPVAEGGTLTLNVTVENAGTEAGTQTLRLLVGNEIRDSESVTLGSGEAQTVTLEWETAAGDGGDYVSLVRTGDDGATERVTVGDATPTWATEYVDEDGVVTLNGALLALDDYENGDLSLDRVLLAIDSYEQERPIHELE